MTFEPVLAGRRIRRLREQKGLSRAWLAQLMGVDVTAISAWENDKYRPRVEKRPVLAQALGASVDELFPDPDAPEPAGTPVIQIPNHQGFAEQLLEMTEIAEHLIRAVHCSRVVSTRHDLMPEFRTLMAERLLANTISLEHVEVVQDLSRLQEILHNIIRYDGHGYHLRAYAATPSVVSTGPNAFVFDDRGLLLGSSWTGDPTGEALRLSVHGGEFVDYFLQRWSEMWHSAVPLNPAGASDLSNLRSFAQELGLAPSDWPAFLESARSLTLPNGSPPFT